MQKKISVFLVFCLTAVSLYAAAAEKKPTAKITAEQAVQKITAGYNKQYKKGTMLIVTESPYYGSTPLAYMNIERDLFIGCAKGECWPYGKESYENGNKFINTERLKQDFPQNPQAATEIEDANDCLGKEYMGGILPQNSNGINTNTFTLEHFEETADTYTFTFNVNCTKQCLGCAEKTKTYTNTETRAYNKKHFFPVKVTIENGNAKREIVYKKAK